MLYPRATHVSDTLNLVRAYLTTTENRSDRVASDDGSTGHVRVLLLGVALATGETSDGSTGSGTSNEESDVLAGKVRCLESVLQGSAQLCFSTTSQAVKHHVTPGCCMDGCGACHVTARSGRFSAGSCRSKPPKHRCGPRLMLCWPPPCKNGILQAPVRPRQVKATPAELYRTHSNLSVGAEVVGKRVVGVRVLVEDDTAGNGIAELLGDTWSVSIYMRSHHVRERWRLTNVRNRAVKAIACQYGTGGDSTLERSLLTRPRYCGWVSFGHAWFL